MIDQPPPAYPEWSVAVTTPAEAAAMAERLIVDHDLDALIVTQRMTAPVMRAVIDAAHAHGRPVVGQIWAVDGEEAARARNRRIAHELPRLSAAEPYPTERLLNYASIRRSSCAHVARVGIARLGFDAADHGER